MHGIEITSQSSFSYQSSSPSSSKSPSGSAPAPTSIALRLSLYNTRQTNVTQQQELACCTWLHLTSSFVENPPPPRCSSCCAEELNVEHCTPIQISRHLGKDLKWHCIFCSTFTFSQFLANRLTWCRAIQKLDWKWAGWCRETCYKRPMAQERAKQSAQRIKTNGVSPP